MNDELRTLIQSKLAEILNLEVSADMPDNFIVDGMTYFAFTLQFDYDNMNYDKSAVYRVALTGYLKRKENPAENTLNILDTKASDIISKLRELNIRASSTDLDVIDNIRKFRITGWCYYDEQNNNLF